MHLGNRRHFCRPASSVNHSRVSPLSYHGIQWQSPIHPICLTTSNGNLQSRQAASCVVNQLQLAPDLSRSATPEPAQILFPTIALPHTIARHTLSPAHNQANPLLPPPAIADIMDMVLWRAGLLYGCSEATTHRNTAGVSALSSALANRHHTSRVCYCCTPVRI